MRDTLRILGELEKPKDLKNKEEKGNKVEVDETKLTEEETKSEEGNKEGDEIKARMEDKAIEEAEQDLMKKLKDNEDKIK